MINPINFTLPIQKIKTLNFKGNTHIETKPDSFEKSPETKLEQAKEYARTRILEFMNNTNKEYGVLISKNGEILEEIEGTESNCKISPDKLQDDCVFIHGHSVKSPLSPRDVSMLLINNIESVEAISPEGQISRMTKTELTPRVNPDTIDDELSKKVCLKFLDEFGIDYSYTEDDLADLFKEYMAYNKMDSEGLSKEDLLKRAQVFGFYDGKDLQKACENVYDTLDLYDISYMQKRKPIALIEQNKDLIDSETYTPRGIRIGNEFLSEIAKEYHLEYETDM